MNKIILPLALLICCVDSIAQECKNCDKPTVINFADIELFGIQTPDDSVLLEQWNKLNILTYDIQTKLSNYFEGRVGCMHVIWTGAAWKEALSTTIGGSPNYMLGGIVTKVSSDYFLKLFIQPICSQKTLGEVDIRFQLYPELDSEHLADLSATQLIPIISKIPEFELQERQSKNLPIANKGNLDLQILNRAVRPGSETEVHLSFKDCDGEYLKNKEITFEGTTGGIFTPAKVTTDADGFAKAKFKLTSSAKAILRAKSVTKNVKGCEAVFTGSEVLAPGHYVKVTIIYEEFEKSVIDFEKAAFLKEIMTGGKDTSLKSIIHVLEFFHKPSPEALKKGYLVFDEKTEIENYGSTSEYISDVGYASFDRAIGRSEMGVNVHGIEVKEKKQRYEESHSAPAPERAATIQFFLGDELNPSYFIMNIEYPLSDTYTAQGATTIVKGDTLTGSYLTKKITNPKSPYKTEYKLKVFKDLHKEYVEGQKNMGVNLDKWSGIVGYRIVDVTILSPY